GQLVIIGAGPFGCRCAPGLRRLGARVSVGERLEIMPKDDPGLVEVVRRAWLADGIELFERHTVVATAGAGTKITMEIEKDGTRRRLEGSHLLLAAGRRPRVHDMGLESPGIGHSDKG